MRSSFILAIVLFIIAVILTKMDMPTLQGAEMLCFLVAIFSGFVGVINSGCECDSSTVK